MIKVIPFTQHTSQSNILASNLYIVVDSKKDAIIIDPSIFDTNLLDFIINNKINLKGVLLTHTHYDHFRGLETLLKHFNVPVYIHKDDIVALNDSKLNCSIYMNENVSINIKAISISDNQILNILKEQIKVIHTPYHTVGSSCFYLEDSKILFSGDSLFCMCIGRTDLPTSVPEMKKQSLGKIMLLPDDVTIYPGHGKTTTIGFERRKNPFLSR